MQANVCEPLEQPIDASTEVDFDGPGAELLSRIAGGVEQRVGRQRFGVWFEKSVRLRLVGCGDGEVIEVVCANDFVCDWVKKHFGPALQASATEARHATIDLNYLVDHEVFEADRDEPGLFRPRAATLPVPQDRSTRVAPGRSDVLVAASMRTTGGDVLPLETPPVDTRRELLRPQPAADRLRHGLDDFLAGPSNRVAYEAACTVAEQPGGAFNPLFIHGGVGLGKTHLLQGICRRYAKLHPAGRWAYLTGEEFTNGFIQALRHHRVDSFRRRMRDLELLVIDDVHFLGGKRATQEEFLHTFNAVEAAGRHVVIASDAHPKTIASFGESLISRFVSGMVARIDPPTREARTQLVAALALRRGLDLSPEVVGWIAQRVTRNVREIEGAITRISAHVRLVGRKPDVRLAAEVLHDVESAMQRPVKAEQIFTACCEFFGLERREFLSGRRQRTISLARSIAMFLTRKLTTLSYPDIAGRMGKRNHSTVISACKRVENNIRRKTPMTWTASTGDRTEPADELVQRLEEHARAVGED